MVVFIPDQSGILFLAMSFIGTLQAEFKVREEAVKDVKLTWPQFWITGLLDYLWLVLIQTPVTRELVSFVKLPPGFWIVFAFFSMFYANRILRVMVLTWKMDLTATLTQNPPPPPPQTETSFPGEM